MWQQLRLLKSEGRHFRRQVAIAGYIADFACHYPKLVVELDGSQHGTTKALAHDEQRSLALAADGYRILRFWNNEVFESLEGVVDRIRHHVRLPTVYEHSSDAGAPPTPSPSPQGGGGQS